MFPSHDLSGAVNGIQVGTGTTGFTRWWWWDYNNSSTYSGVIQVEVLSATINYTFQVTLDDVQSDATPITFNPLAAFVNGTTSQFGPELNGILFSFGRLFINSSNATGSLKFTVYQAGIGSG